MPFTFRWPIICLQPWGKSHWKSHWREERRRSTHCWESSHFSLSLSLSFLQQQCHQSKCMITADRSSFSLSWICHFSNGIHLTPQKVSTVSSKNSEISWPLEEKKNNCIYLTKRKYFNKTSGSFIFQSSSKSAFNQRNYRILIKRFQK